MTALFTTARPPCSGPATARTPTASADGYYTSLDGGAGRNERIRYDSPSVGPVSAAISVGNGDQVSAGISLSQEFGGTSFNAGVGTIQWGGSDKFTISGSAGVSLASGISISGAWGTGKDFAGMTIPGMDAVPPSVAVPAVPAVPAMDAMYMSVNTRQYRTLVVGTANTDAAGEEMYIFTGGPTPSNDELPDNFVQPADTDDQSSMTFPMALQAERDAMEHMDATEQDIAEAMSDIMALFGMDMYGCPDPMMAGAIGDADEAADSNCSMRLYKDAVPEVPEVPEVIEPGMASVAPMDTTTDPSFFQVAVSYAFGDTSVGVSWYQSSDMYNEGSELTAIGFGVDHNLPKLGTNVYAAAQNYNIEDDAAGMDADTTVVMIGARVKF